MRAIDAKEICEAARVDPACYEIGSPRHEAICLLAVRQTWNVFVFERGERFEERQFSSEDEACVYFLKRVFVLANRAAG